jgi:hypothetical protein
MAVEISRWSLASAHIGGDAMRERCLSISGQSPRLAIRKSIRE